MRNRFAGRTLALALAVATYAAPAAVADEISQTQGLRKAMTLEGVRAHQAAFQMHSDLNGGNRVGGSPGYEASANYVTARAEAAGYTTSDHFFDFVFNADATPPTLIQTAPDATTYVDGVDFASMTFSGSIAPTTRAVWAVDLVLPQAPGPGAHDVGLRGLRLRRHAGGLDRAHAARDVSVRREGRPRTRLRRRRVDHLQRRRRRRPHRRHQRHARRGRPRPRGRHVAGRRAGPRERHPVRQHGLDRDDPDRPRRREPHDAQRHRRDAGRRPEPRRRRRRAPGLRPARARHQRQRLGLGGDPRDRRDARRARDRPAQQDPLHVVRRRGVRAASARRATSRPAAVRARQDRRDAQLRHGRLAELRALRLRRRQLGVPGRAGRRAAGPPGSGEIERIFPDYFASQGLASAETPFSGRSDYGPFIAAGVGIPAGGLFTGAEGIKTAAEAAVYGGTAGQPYDPCYHLFCDTFANNSNYGAATR